MKTNKGKFNKISYDDLNKKQKEIHNYDKLSSKLADYGFGSILLSDDWLGADFLAIHIDKKTILKIQLKGSFSFNKNYIGKDLLIAFRDGEVWYCYPHDELLELLKADINDNDWINKGTYFKTELTKKLKILLSDYIIE